ncbi:hypothetical protein NYE67_11850 [Solibacillus sp. FSL W8-0474]|uniref:hypothetical protein n=1 Tax=Solibacillus sp. FSL W8-0474 TaxID=2975336 RepID=UPI0030F723E5
MIQLLGWILLWGIPILLIWSIVLSIIRFVKEPKLDHFLERILLFIGLIYSYIVNSLAAWFGLISFIMGILGYLDGTIIGPTMLTIWSIFNVLFFPSIQYAGMN